MLSLSFAQITIMKLKHEITLGRSAFCEIGSPTGIWRSENGQLMAVASFFPNSQTNARDSCYRNQRIAVYDCITLRCLFIFDGCKLPINGIAFHPSRTLIAVASGSYDGGYMYEGSLTIVNLATGEYHSVLSDNRLVLNCRFIEYGTSLEFAIAPPTEDHMPIATLHRTMEFDCSNISLPEIVSEIPFDDCSASPTLNYEALKKQLSSHATLHEGPCIPRWGIWDLAWRSSNQLVCVRNNATVEIFNLDDSSTKEVHLQERGIATELFLLDNGATAVVNVFNCETSKASSTRSTIYRVDLELCRVTKSRKPRWSCTLSKSRNGVFLARDTHWVRRASSCDFLLDSNLNTLAKDLNLGHYDLFNHFVRIDNSDKLFFLRATPQTSHENKKLCTIDPETFKVSVFCDHDRFVKGVGHLMDSCACMCEDADGSAIVIASKVYPSKRDGFRYILRKVRLESGKTTWQQTVDHHVTALVQIPEHRLVAVGFVTGELYLLSADNPKEWSDLQFNARSPILSMAYSENCLALGTLDGLVHVFSSTS